MPTPHGDLLDTSQHPVRPRRADRRITNVTAQRQVPPTLPKRRLGLGAPLSDPPGDSPARAVTAADRPLVGRYPGSPIPGGAGGGTPQEPASPRQRNEAGQERPPAAPGSPPALPAGSPPTPAGVPEPAPPTMDASAGPASADPTRQPDLPPSVQASLVQASLVKEGQHPAPSAEGLPNPHRPRAGESAPAEAASDPAPAEAASAPKPPVEAPLIGAPQSALPGGGPPLADATTAVTQRATSLPGKPPLASTPPALQAIPAAVPRLAAPSAATPGGLGTPGSPAAVTRQPADPGPEFAAPSWEPRPTDQPGQRPLSAQRLSADSPAPPSSPRHAAVAPLLGSRPPVRTLDGPSGSWTGTPPVEATSVPDTAARVGVVPGSVPGAIQRSAPGLPPASRLSEQAPQADEPR